MRILSVTVWLLASCGTGSLYFDDTGGTTNTVDTSTTPSGRCNADITPQSDTYEEGDSAVIVVSCEGGEQGFSLEVLEGPDSMTSEGWVLFWNTGLSSAGHHDVTVSISGGEGLPEIVTTTIDIADAWDESSNMPVIPADYLTEFGLPVIHITSAGTITESYSEGVVWLDGTANPAEIKIRGASSSYYPQNAYTLKFPEDPIDLDDHGLQNKNRLVLISLFDDNSYIRQKLTYDLWMAMAEQSGADDRLTPRTFFTVVYLNGAYNGLYVAVDHIDDEFVGEFGFNRDGNLYKSVDHDANFYEWSYYGGNKHDLAQGYEQKEGSSSYADLRALVAFTSGSSNAEFAAAAEDWFSVEEFMDWFLLVHFLNAQDSAGKNAYLYSDPEAPRFRYVPWDFNHSVGQDWMTLRIDSDYVDDLTWANGIFEHFQQHPGLALQLNERFDALLEDGGLFSWASLRDRLDGYWDQITPSADRAWARWSDEYESYGGWAYYRDYYGTWEDWLGERKYVTDWLRERVDLMRSR
jgi:spore coat protein H